MKKLHTIELGNSEYTCAQEWLEDQNINLDRSTDIRLSYEDCLTTIYSYSENEFIKVDTACDIQQQDIYSLTRAETLDYLNRFNQTLLLHLNH